MFYDCELLLSIRDISFDNSNFTDINEPFYENNSNNSSEKFDDSNENDNSQTFYKDNLALSTIQKNTNSSTFTEINDLNF